MTLKETFKKLYDSDPRVQETIDKMFPNDHLVKEIVNGIEKKLKKEGLDDLNQAVGLARRN